MHFFHKNKSQPSFPETFQAGAETDSAQQGANPHLPGRYSLAIPSDGPQLPLYPHPNEHPVHPHQHSQQQQQPHSHNNTTTTTSSSITTANINTSSSSVSNSNYTHPAHSVTGFNHDLPDLPPLVPRPLGRRPTLNLVPTSPTTGLGSSSDLSSTEPPYTPHSSEASPLVESQPRKIRKGIFGLSLKDKHKDKEPTSRSTKVLGRSISVRRKATTGKTSSDQRTPDGHPLTSEIDSPQVKPVNGRMPLHSKKNSQSDSLYTSVNRSASNIEGQPFEPPRIQRVNTEPPSQELYHPRQSSLHYQENHQPDSYNPQLQIDPAHLRQRGSGHPTGGSHVFIDQASGARSQSPQLTPRPSSQQSFGPPSPLNPQYQGFESNQPKPRFQQSLQPPTGQIPVQGGMERQLGLRQASDPMGQNAQPQSTQGSAMTSSSKGNMSQPAPSDLDRDTPPPPPSKNRDEVSETDVRALIQKHDELQAKYMKVKRYYFEKEAQVQQLQNTVAHQRMSTSRTVLDDNEYATRFGRLDGAINNFSFNIRKDWKSIPPWLQAVANENAHIVGTKEMTAIGRACLTRWLVDEVFDRFFHPSLEPTLSRQLKMIERNVRQMNKAVTDEDRENHLAKLSSWRRTTLDGLGDCLQGKLAEDHRTHLIMTLVEKLTASLEMNLKDPPPPGLQNEVSMIIELAIGIASNIPLESRDVIVEYFLPGAPIAESHMKLETPLPPLTGIDSRGVSEPSSAATERGDQASMKELAVDPSDGDSLKDSSYPMPNPQGRKKSVFGSLISKKQYPSNHQPDSSRPGSSAVRESKDRDEVERDETVRNIRFAAFVSVEIRGKGADNVIVKAPVYGLV